MTLTSGSNFGRYEIQRLLGSGGMGEVYSARDPVLQRTVAIKILPQDFAVQQERRTRFELEARAAGVSVNVIKTFLISTS